MTADNASISRDNTAGKQGLRWPQVVLIILVTMAVTIGGTYWFVKTYVFAREFKPVELSVKEEQVLENKLRALGYDVDVKSPERLEDQSADIDDRGFLKPERYTEDGARREVSFNERELNALLAKNTDLAKKLAIDLSDDLVSAKLLLPLEEDFPVLGGKTLRLNAGVEMAYAGEKPVIVLKGVSVMGVPVPNAWLGGLKNIDLVGEFGADEGFWKSFSDGVENIQVEDGRIRVRLRE
jgi:hypothetical protein